MRKWIYVSFELLSAGLLLEEAVVALLSVWVLSLRVGPQLELVGLCGHPGQKKGLPAVLALGV